jgi:molybdenum cofactor cytidylyltransferase
VVAAGGSRRLGAPKQLLRRRTRPLLLHAIDAARSAADIPIVVVLGAQSLRLRALLRRHGGPVRVVVNARWQAGLSTSLKAGLAAIPRNAAGALVTLVDQPDVDAACLRRLIAAWRRRPLVPAAARYEGRAGVPAILPRRSWRAARKLHGDSGARTLLRDAAALTLVEMPEAAFDVDTPADAARLR